MTAYRKAGHSRVYYVTVTDAEGRPHRISTGTHDAETARAMETMLAALAARGKRDWDLVRALVETVPVPGRRHGRRRLKLADLYDAWRASADRPGALDELRARMADVDLAAHVPAWLAAVAKTVKAGTVRQYTRNVARLCGTTEAGALAPLWRSALTPALLAERRDAVPGTVPNQLAHLTAWSSFLTWCVERGLLAANPLTSGAVAWPRDPDRARKVRERHIARLADVERFVAAFPTPESRAIAALREGVGADWDALEPMRREHVLDAAARRLYLPGDKTGNRAREVQVEPWAWAHLAAYLAASPALPGAPLFTLAYDTYKSMHNRTRDALVAAGVAIPPHYSPHNARHSFAVRKRRDGWPDWKIASYLGNTAAEISRTYGNFTPTAEDLTHDEHERAAQLKRRHG